MKNFSVEETTCLTNAVESTLYQDFRITATVIILFPKINVLVKKYELDYVESLIKEENFIIRLFQKVSMLCGKADFNKFEETRKVIFNDVDILENIRVIC